MTRRFTEIAFGPNERAFVLEVEAFDWNCPQHITPRYSLEELGALGLQHDAEKERP